MLTVFFLCVTMAFINNLLGFNRIILGIIRYLHACLDIYIKIYIRVFYVIKRSGGYLEKSLIMFIFIGNNVTY